MLKNKTIFFVVLLLNGSLLGSAAQSRKSKQFKAQIHDYCIHIKEFMESKSYRSSLAKIKKAEQSLERAGKLYARMSECEQSQCEQSQAFKFAKLQICRDTFTIFIENKKK